MIVYGVGDRRLMGLFEVTGRPVMASDEEIAAIHWKPRWPWHIPARNLALAYSKAWSAFNVRVGNLRDEHNSTHPGQPVTNAGSRALGTLNRGNDKVRLHPAFARFLVDRLWTAQRSLITAGQKV